MSQLSNIILCGLRYRWMRQFKWLLNCQLEKTRSCFGSRIANDDDDDDDS